MYTDADSVNLLAELAFIAGGRGLTEHTENLVAALAVLRPGNERPHLIQAFAQLSRGDAVGAERTVREQALKINPNSAMALAFLGLALHPQGRINERDQVLRSALDVGDDDQDAARLARDLLATPAG